MICVEESGAVILDGSGFSLGYFSVEFAHSIDTLVTGWLASSWRFPAKGTGRRFGAAL